MTPAIPETGKTMTVHLPGEIIRVTVGEVVDNDSFRAVIMMAPLGKTHTYKLGDSVLFRRMPGQIGDTWDAVDENKTLLDRLRRETEARDLRAAEGARRVRG